jgi:hypothetical protein
MTEFDEVLEIEQASARYDAETRITYITYRGELDAAVTIQVYDWLDRVYKAVGIENVYGQIFDFRKVIEFAPSNLSTARRTSNRMNMSLDTSHFPVALIVATRSQEEILRGPMRIPEGHQRKAIVWDEKEAHDFLDSWYENKD